MTDPAAAPRRTVTLRSPSGKPLLTLRAVPAALAAAAALVVAPRLTAVAALAALARKMTLTIEAPESAAPPA